MIQQWSFTGNASRKLKLQSNPIMTNIDYRYWRFIVGILKPQYMDQHSSMSFKARNSTLAFCLCLPPAAGLVWESPDHTELQLPFAKQRTAPKCTV